MKWEVVGIHEDMKGPLKAALDAGWEPFAVTQSPGLPAQIWLRRQVKA